MNKKLLLIVIIVVIGASAFFMFGLPKTPKGHELTIDTNIEEAGTVSGGGRYEFNEDLSVKAIANTGYYFLGWYFGEDLLSTSEEYNCKMWDKSVTLEAKFIALPPEYSESGGGSAMYQEYSLTVKSAMPNLGKVNLNDQGAKQEYKVTTTTGTNFKFLALTTSANRFLGWFDADDNLITTNGVFNFAMPTFEYTLSAKWDCPATDGVALINNTYICETCGGYSCKIFSNDGGFKMFEESNKKILISYSGDQTQIKIPDGVNKIGNESFKYHTNITSIEIPSSVTEIGSSAFSACSSLTSIKLPNSVTSIGDSAFRGCSRLTEITLPFVGATLNGTSNSHFGYIFGASSYSYNDHYIPNSLNKVTITGGSSIGSSAFYGCSGLWSVEIPESVTSIGERAFSGCSSLQFNVYNNAKYLGNLANPYHALIKGANSNISSISIHADAKVIADNAFYGYSRLVSVVIGDSVTSIGDAAFQNCSSLTSIEIPKSVTSIGSYAFYNCSGLTSIEIPDSVTSIGSYAFSSCDSLTSVVIPDSVTSIGNSAFWNCDSLTSVVIPDSVTSIGDDAFWNCDSLTSVVIGNSVTSIGDDAFRSCDSLTKVYYKGNSTEWSNITIGSVNSNLTNATRYYYSETQPMVSGKFWHYDENGAIVEW